MTNQVAYHKWEELSLAAPYRLVGLIELPPKSLLEANPHAYNLAMQEKQHEANANGVHLGTCNVCGTAIMNNYVCKDSAGKGFVVGCECVKKTGDTILCSQVEKAEKIRARNKRREAAEQRRKERESQREAILQQQRERNGGFTDFELECKRQEEETKKRFEKSEASNSWLIEVLENVSGGFAADMVQSLCQRPLAQHSPRQISIMRDIYAKSFGRRNSKKYESAIDLFDEKSEA